MLAWLFAERSDHTNEAAAETELYPVGATQVEGFVSEVLTYVPAVAVPVTLSFKLYVSEVVICCSFVAVKITVPEVASSVNNPVVPSTAAVPVANVPSTAVPEASYNLIIVEPPRSIPAVLLIVKSILFHPIEEAVSAAMVNFARVSVLAVKRVVGSV